jgi:hypothetical protein
MSGIMKADMFRTSELEINALEGLKAHILRASLTSLLLDMNYLKATLSSLEDWREETGLELQSHAERSFYESVVIIHVKRTFTKVFRNYDIVKIAELLQNEESLVSVNTIFQERFIFAIEKLIYHTQNYVSLMTEQEEEQAG